MSYQQGNLEKISENMETHQAIGNLLAASEFE